MKKIFILFSIASVCMLMLPGYGQNTFPATGPVGIGTTSPVASSLLDMRSTSRGLLIPRMTLAQRNLIGAPAVSLLIYQTDGTTGYYYYTGTGWIRLVTSAALTNLSNLAATVAVNSNFTPASTGTLSIGSLARKWRKGYFSDSVIAGNVTAGASSIPIGVRGTGGSYGVYGSGGTFGVYGNGTSYGVYGASSSGYGVVGSSGYIGTYGSGSSYGLYGVGGTYGGYASGTSYGLYGTSPSGYGVAGVSTNSYGLYGSSSNSWGSVAYGVYGAYGSGTTGYGVQGVSNSSYGVYGYSGSSYGVYGNSTNNWAVYGNGYIGTYGNGTYVGAWGNGTSYGLVGYGGPYGVWGQGTSYAGYFAGNVYCSGTYSGSDKSLKRNIKEFTSALDIINKLKPRQYEYRHDGNYSLMNLPEGSHFGLVAQDVEEVLPNLVKETKFETNLVKPVATKQDAGSNASSVTNAADASSETISFKAVNYTELIPVLIKAIQELSKENAQIKEELELLKSGKYPSLHNGISLSDAALLQNTPNPFKSNTIINYSLPAKFLKAQIVVYDMSGKTLKQIGVSGAGRGTLKIDAGALSSGTYNYSLVVDGETVSTKQLIIAK